MNAQRLVPLLWLALGLLAARHVPQALAEDAGAAADAAPAASAKAAPDGLTPRVLLSVTPNQGLYVGDPITFQIVATVPKGVQVSVPEQSLAPFEAVDRRTRLEVTDGEIRHIFELDLIALEPGQLTIPALTLRSVRDDGALAEAKTSPQPVQVQSLLANEPNAEPKPPTAPVAVIEDDYTLAWIFAALLGIAAIAAATLLVQRWLAQRPKAAPPPPPEKPAWEVALGKLAELDGRRADLLAENRGEEFVDGVSDALREYLGKRYGFEGLESTTDELLRALERVRPHQLSLSGVSLLLEQCDLVKFARATPDLAQCDDIWNGAVGLIRATTPVPSLDASASHVSGRAS